VYSTSKEVRGRRGFTSTCLEGREDSRKEHKDTLLSKSLLARILGEQWRYNEAESVYHDHLMVLTDFGEWAWGTLWTAYWLADSLYQLGKFKKLSYVSANDTGNGEAIWERASIHAVCHQRFSKALDDWEIRVSWEMDPRAIEDDSVKDETTNYPTESQQSGKIEGRAGTWLSNLSIRCAMVTTHWKEYS